MALVATLPVGVSALSACSSNAGDAGEEPSQTGGESLQEECKITDHAGRELTVPVAEKLERIYFTSALAQTFVLTLAPELQGGTGVQFTPQELEYLPTGTGDLLYMGSLSGKGELDYEMLIKEDIQLVFSIGAAPLTDSDISEAEELQEAVGVPVVCVDGSFDKIAEAYRFIGDIVGRRERAETIAAFLETIYEDVTAALADVKDEERVSFYYAEGSSGLETEPGSSQHALTFEVAKARNVVEVESSTGAGMSEVSLESVIAWDPEVIIAWDDMMRGGADEIIRENPDWSVIRAVQDRRVYTMPNAPFAWCDRPPGVNRFLGIQWVANMLYPRLYEVDMVEETKKFYSELYWVDISDEQAKELLGNSYPVYGKD